LQARLDTAPEFRSLEIVDAVPYRHPRGVRKGAIPWRYYPSAWGVADLAARV